MTSKLETPSLKGTPERLHYCETCAGECERIDVAVEAAVAEKEAQLQQARDEANEMRSHYKRVCKDYNALRASQVEAVGKVWEKVLGEVERQGGKHRARYTDLIQGSPRAERICGAIEALIDLGGTLKVIQRQAKADGGVNVRDFFCHWLARVYEAGHRDTSYEEGETLDSVLREINQVLGFSGYEPESSKRAELLTKQYAWNALETARAQTEGRTK